jgi:hypothetical protein
MSCVFGHTHRVAQEQGRTQRPVVGYNVGCGIKLDVGYAQTRRQTLGWAHGLCWFEYTDNLTIVRWRLCRRTTASPYEPKARPRLGSLVRSLGRWHGGGRSRAAGVVHLQGTCPRREAAANAAPALP